MHTDHDLHLTLLPSTNDGALFSRKRQQAITRFYVEARADGSRINPAGFVLDTAGLQGGFSGEFVVSLGDLAGPALGAAAHAWLNGRAGRKINLRIRETDHRQQLWRDQRQHHRRRYRCQCAVGAVPQAPRLRCKGRRRRWHWPLRLLAARRCHRSSRRQSGSNSYRSWFGSRRVARDAEV